MTITCSVFIIIVKLCHENKTICSINHVAHKVDGMSTHPNRRPVQKWKYYSNIEIHCLEKFDNVIRGLFRLILLWILQQNAIRSRLERKHFVEFGKNISFMVITRMSQKKMAWEMSPDSSKRWNIVESSSLLVWKLTTMFSFMINFGKTQNILCVRDKHLNPGRNGSKSDFPKYLLSLTVNGTKMWSFCLQVTWCSSVERCGGLHRQAVGKCKYSFEAI